MRTFSVLAAVIFAAAVSAQQPATYEIYGHGCAGTGVDPVVCGSLNDKTSTFTPIGNNTALPNEYCYHHKAASAITVVGIRLWSRTLSTNPSELIGIGFYRAVSGAPSTTPEVIGTMLVTNTDDFHTGYFSTPVTVAANEEFWVSQFDSNVVRAAGTSNGVVATGTTYWRRPANSTSAWSATGIVSNPSYHILCMGSGTSGTGIPNLMHTGLPKLGATFSVDIHHAPMSVATLLLGVSDTTSWGVPLPLDLGLFGAPGCKVFASAEFMVPAGVPINGSASVKLTVPNSPTLSGFKFYNQFWIVEPSVNAMGLTTTNAGVGTIGT
ncbi:MAG: hypothetical protein KDC87_21795 [Planctomycetes bacterium]|nr:hypothetical protein [Planctomycetota bacterium]MCB9869818.1 hypothetical protein [Planctomycetota bacterium]